MVEYDHEGVGSAFSLQESMRLAFSQPSVLAQMLQHM
jgi:hypothetical protein